MKIATTIQLTKTQFLEVKKKANETGNSFSSIIRDAVEHFLNIKHEEDF